MEASHPISDHHHQSMAAYSCTAEPTLMNTPTDQAITTINTIILNSQIPARAQRFEPDPSQNHQLLGQKLEIAALSYDPQHICDDAVHKLESNQLAHELSTKTECLTPEPSAYQIPIRGQRMEPSPSPHQQIPARGQRLEPSPSPHQQIPATQQRIEPSPSPHHQIPARGQRLVMEGSPHPLTLGAQPARSHHQFIASSSGATGLRLPPIMALDSGIKPDISLCSRVLKSFSDQDQASSDLEVQSVMFPENGSLLPTVKRICPSRSSSSSKSSKSSYSPMRQPTTLTNAKRGNVQTTTPTFLPEDMTLHQLAAQGELTLLNERLETFTEKVDKTDVQGYTPLMWACAHDQIDTVELLIRFGADPSAVSVEGECALSFTCSNGNVQILRMLLTENVDVNNYDWNSGTPLLYAVYNNHPKCCELLLEAGADLTIETDSGHTALSLAVSLGHHQVQHIIEKHMLGLLQKI